MITVVKKRKTTHRIFKRRHWPYLKIHRTEAVLGVGSTVGLGSSDARTRPHTCKDACQRCAPASTCLSRRAPGDAFPRLRRRARLRTSCCTADCVLSAGRSCPRHHSEGDSRLIARASQFSAPQTRRDDYRPIDVTESPLTPANAICTRTACRFAGTGRAR